MTRVLIIVLLVYAACGKDQNNSKIHVFAAASTGDLMNILASQFEANHDIQLHLTLAASSTLARQIDQGAPADLFLSANTQWIDWLNERERLESGSIREMMGNRLVLIARKDREAIPFSFTGRLAIGDPTHVPAGIYAVEAMENLGHWTDLKDRLAPAAHVRDALRWVTLGESEQGIVYASDVLDQASVQVLLILPEDSHTPIRYPLALTKKPTPEAQAFYEYLLSDQARNLAQSKGFLIIP